MASNLPPQAVMWSWTFHGDYRCTKLGTVLCYWEYPAADACKCYQLYGHQRRTLWSYKFRLFTLLFSMLVCFNNIPLVSDIDGGRQKAWRTAIASKNSTKPNEIWKVDDCMHWQYLKVWLYECHSHTHTLTLNEFKFNVTTLGWSKHTVHGFYNEYI